MRKINIQCLVETILYILFATALLAIIISDGYLSYVTPRMKPYLYFAVVILFIFGILGFFRLYQFSYKPKITHCLVILIPLVILLIPKNGIDLHILTSGYINGGTLNEKNSTTSSITSTYPFSSSQNKQDSKTDNNATAPSSPDGYLTKNFFQKKLELHGYSEMNKTIHVSNEEFYAWIRELSSKPERFEDYTITMTGFVYHDNKFMSDNEFVPARLVMSCCVADVVPGGIICKYDKTDQLQNDTWVTVTGKFTKGEYNGKPEPQIMVESITFAQPVNGYVYPY